MKPLIKETVKILKKVETVAENAVKNLGNGISKSLSNTAKLLGGAVRSILQTRLPRISYRLPRVQLPRVNSLEYDSFGYLSVLHEYDLVVAGVKNEM